MKCPYCFGDVPENNYKCPHCRKVIKSETDPASVYQSTSARKTFNLTAFLFIVIVAGLAIIGFMMLQQGNKTDQNNQSHQSSGSLQPGERINLNDLLAPGKTTIFDFYSEYCGPCLKISPRLERLDELNDDIAVVKIDINRKNIRGIDWNSPVARQYKLRSIPYFIIFDSSGQQSHEGSSAWRQVYEYLREKGI
jgi:thiol-disulfide isomerase/thioredoxin